MAQGFILTHTGGTPRKGPKFSSAGDGQRALQVTLHAKFRGVSSADQVPRAQHILPGEQGFRLTLLALKDFTASRCMAFTVAPIAN
ncbi:hypothetical protein ACNKHW_00400 [Shigella flexneri]